MMQAIIPTPEQKVIIEESGSLVAIARPGSGKTYVISEKIRDLVGRSRPYQGVIAISYTNKASAEIQRRVKYSGSQIGRSFFGTIDKFCTSEITLPFLPHLWGRSVAEVSISRIDDLSENYKGIFDDVEPNKTTREDFDRHLAILMNLFREGSLLLEFIGWTALYVLENSKACRAYITSRYTHIFVDEYQDSGLEQHELFLRLQSLGLVAIAVGDVDQAIFGFSGKDSKYLVALANTKKFKTYPINFNHRCHPSIINYSLRLLDGNCELIHTDNVHVAYTSISGAQSEIAKWIGKCLEGYCRTFDVGRLSDVGILVRTSKSAEIIDQNLPQKHRYVRTHPLEEHFSSWSKLFARLLEYHFTEKITAQSIIDEFCTRVVRPNDVRICRQEIKKLRRVDLPLLVDFIKVARLICPNGNSEQATKLLSEALEDPRLESWFLEPADDEIQIMTIHKAKGLEFDIVFHLDMYEWVLPAKGPGGGTDWENPEYSSWEQDLHLHYVGVTRARKCCVLLSSTRRINSSGQERSGVPSEFLKLPGTAVLRKNINGS